MRVHVDWTRCDGHGACAERERQRRRIALRVEAEVHRMLLHAERLRFPHPDGGTVDVRAPVDGEFQKALDLFGWQVP